MEEPLISADSSRETSEQQALPLYSEDGVDLTLIRWMLSLTPTERLQMLQEHVQSLARLCNEAALT